MEVFVFFDDKSRLRKKSFLDPHGFPPLEVDLRFGFHPGTQLPPDGVLVEAMPILCSGTHREMGLVQGRNFRTLTQGLRSDLARLEAFRIQRPWWLPYPLFLRLAERRAVGQLWGVFRQQCPDQAERLAAIAEGAGVSLDTMVLFNAFESALSDLGDSTASVGGCSAVAVRGRRSANGETMIAKNFDYLPLFQPYYLVRESRPTEGQSALEFTCTPLAGAVDGVNEAGLTITYNYAFTTDAPPEPAPPVSFRISEALQHCTTVGDAVEWITSRTRWGGALLMLADAEGEIASLELSNTAFDLRRPAPGEDLLHHTNRFATDSMQDRQFPDDTVYTKRAPQPLRGRRLHESSERRGGRMAELLDGTETFTPDDLARVMGDHGPDDTPGDYTVCVHGSYWYTTASLQLFPKSRRLRVSRSTTCEADYVELELG